MLFEALHEHLRLKYVNVFRVERDQQEVFRNIYNSQAGWDFVFDSWLKLQKVMIHIRDIIYSHTGELSRLNMATLWDH